MTDLPLRRDPIRVPGAGEFRWTLKRANWTQFTELSEEDFSRGAPRGGTRGAEQQNARFVAVVRQAAEKAIPRAAARMPGKENKAWWSKEVAELVKVRQEARRTAERTGEREDITRWHQARDRSNKVIHRAKQASWRDFASTLSVSTDPSKIFSTIKSMDGR